MERRDQDDFGYQLMFVPRSRARPFSPASFFILADWEYVCSGFFSLWFSAG
jgi:hypothetical protein